MIAKMKFSLLVLALSTVYAEAYYLQTRLGPINGSTDMAWDGNPVVTFKGIPYGKAPVGDHRFKHSVPYGGWNKTHNATKYAPACMQRKGWSMGMLEEVESEDCLFLNIYVPNTVENMPKRSVMVWVHGGGFVMGASHLYEGGTLASQGDVIVVTINYRLGLFGFFTTGDTTIPGNMGIGDQILALKWVHDNIADYGGDPDSVTIFGESAGGWAVSVLTASPQAEGLFNRVIGMSGTIMYTKHRNEMGMQAMQLADDMSCSAYTTQAVLDCFREMKAEDINAIMVPQQFDMQVFTDDYIVPWMPYDAWSAGYANKVDYMVGVTSGDGGIMLDWIMPYVNVYQNGVDEATIKGVIEMYTWQTPYPKNCSMAAEIVSKQYFHNDFSDPGKNLKGLIDFLTDVIFLAPSMELARFVPATGHSVFWYYFDQPPKAGTKEGDAIVEVGAPHGSELYHIFGWYMIREWYPDATEADHKLTMSMMKAWTSFAKTGNPVWIDNNDMEQSWPRYNWGEGYFLQWNDKLDSEKMVEELEMDARADFWLYTLAECRDMISSSACTLGAVLAMVVPFVMAIFKFRV